MSNLNLFACGSHYVGVWSSGTTYKAKDVVKGSNASPYICKVTSSIGNDPTSSPTQWDVLLSAPPVITVATVDRVGGAQFGIQAGSSWAIRGGSWLLENTVANEVKLVRMRANCDCNCNCDCSGIDCDCASNCNCYSDCNCASNCNCVSTCNCHFDCNCASNCNCTHQCIPDCACDCYITNCDCACACLCAWPGLDCNVYVPNDPYDDTNCDLCQCQCINCNNCLDCDCYSDCNCASGTDCVSNCDCYANCNCASNCNCYADCNCWGQCNCNCSAI